MPEKETLRVEARLLGRLILGRDPAAEHVERYVGAHDHLFAEPVDSTDAALLSMAMRRPALLGSLDAAAALLRPRSLLHRKALLMAAILEASPAHADDFLPRRTTWGGLIRLGFSTGIMTVARLIVGVPALLVAGKRR